MKTLESKLEPVRLRMGANRFLADALLGLALGWGVAALLVLVHRLFFLPFATAWIPWAATLAPLGGALTAAWLRRATIRQAAVLVDDRLALAERLSSALLVEGSTPMEQAVRADAESRLGRILPGTACPLALPRRRGWLALSALGALALALLLKDFDLLGRRDADAKAKELLQVRTAAAAAVERKIQKFQEEAKVHAELGEMGKGLEALAKDLKEGIQDSKAALAEVSDLQARLKHEMEQFQEKDKAAMAKDLERALKGMQAEEGKAPAGAQADALKDMMQELKELAQKAESGKATPEDLAEMQKTLSSLAEALKDTEATRELAQELQRTAQAMQEQQKEGAMPQLGDNLKNLGEKLGQMDKALDREQAMEMAKADLDELKQQLGGKPSPWDSEVSPEDQEAFDQQMAEAAEGKGQGKGKGEGEGSGEGEGQGQGQGQGQAGQPGMGGGQGPGGQPGPPGGNASAREPELANLGYDRTKLKGPLGEGEFIGSFFVKGVPPKGPSEAKYVEMLGEYQHQASEALEKEPIPAAQREQVRRYFDSLKPPPGEPPAKP